MCSILFSNKPVSADKYNLLKLRGPDATTSRSIAGYNFVHQECNCTSMAKNSLKLYEQVLRNNHNNREV